MLYIFLPCSWVVFFHQVLQCKCKTLYCIELIEGIWHTMLLSYNTVIYICNTVFLHLSKGCWIFMKLIFVCYIFYVEFLFISAFFLEKDASFFVPLKITLFNHTISLPICPSSPYLQVKDFVESYSFLSGRFKGNGLKG